MPIADEPGGDEPDEPGGDGGTEEPDPCTENRNLCLQVLHRWPSTNPDGTPCYRSEMEWYLPDEVPPEAEYYPTLGVLYRWTGPDTWFADNTIDGASPTVCWGFPPVDLPPTPDDIGSTLADHLAQHLPAPTLQTNPNRMVVGLPTYLIAQWDDDTPTDPDAPDTLSIHVADLALDVNGRTFAISFDAVGRYEVAWGDGITTTHTVEGEPHPHGEVTHIYQDASEDGTRTLSVQEFWTVTWTVAGIGTFAMPGEVTPPPTTFTAELREHQATIDG